MKRKLSGLMFFVIHHLNSLFAPGPDRILQVAHDLRRGREARETGDPGTR